MNLTKVSIARPVTMLMVIGALVIAGVISFTRMPVRQLPNVNFPFVHATITDNGANPTDIERLVVDPMEQALSTVTGVVQMTAVASPSRGTVTLEFQNGTNTSIAAVDVSQALARAARAFPVGSLAPVITAANPSALPLMNIAMSGRLSQAQLYTLAEERVAPALDQVAGIASVNVVGGRQPQVNVLVEPTAMEEYRVSLAEIMAALATSNKSVPAGSVVQGGTTYLVRSSGLFHSAAQLQGVVVAKRPGGDVVLGDVAQVSLGFARSGSAAELNGVPAVGLVITAQSTANSLAVDQAVHAALTALTPSLPPGTQLTVVGNITRFTRASLHDVEFDLVLAVLITGIVLLAFLHRVQNTLIVLAAIPTSLIITFTVMYALHFSLDLISLMALSLLIGILVDDAIVVLENINRHISLGEAVREAAYRGRMEIGAAAVAITLTDVVVYGPTAFLTGNVGQLFREFGLTITAATLISLFISFTLTPMLASRWLKPRALPGGTPQPDGAGADGADQTSRADSPEAGLLATSSGAAQAPAAFSLGGIPPGDQAARHSGAAPGDGTHPGEAASWPIGATAGSTAAETATLPSGRFAAAWERAYGALVAHYRRAVRWSLRHRGTVLLVALGALVFSALAVPAGWVGTTFAPKEDIGTFTVQLRFPPTVTLAESQADVHALAAQLRHQSGVVEVYASAGYGAGVGTGTGVGQITVDLLPKGQRPGLFTYYQPLVLRLAHRYPGMTAHVAVQNPLVLPGGRSLQIQLTGSSLTTLQSLAQSVQQRIDTLGGVTNVSNTALKPSPQLSLTISQSEANYLGISSGAIGGLLAEAVGGRVATTLQPSASVPGIPVYVQILDGATLSNQQLSDLPIPTPHGMVPLAQVAHVRHTIAPARLEFVNRQLAVNVVASVVSNDLGKVAIEAAAALRGMPMPPGYTWTLGGQVAQQQAAFGPLGAALALSVVLIYMLLAALYESLLYPLILILTLPLATVGAMLALIVTGNTLNIFSFIGLIMLTGLVAKNAILLVDYTGTLRRRGYPLIEALVEAGSVRMRPILMTTATMVFAMLPLAISNGAGSEDRQPMAVVVIGGVVTSTLLTLVVVPVMYSVMTQFTDWVGRPHRARLGVATQLSQEPSGTAR